jgi:predicted nucleic acid-binding protein
VWYWDTSALLKLYVPEHDSAYFLSLIETATQPVYSSTIAATEAACAFHRKEHAGDLKPGASGVLLRRFRADCQANRLVLAPYGGDVVEEVDRLLKIAFSRRHPIAIRSLDVIHIATARIIKAEGLVATDSRLRSLAAALGILLIPVEDRAVNRRRP